MGRSRHVAAAVALVVGFTGLAVLGATPRPAAAHRDRPVDTDPLADLVATLRRDPAAPPESAIDRNFAVMLGGITCGRTDLGPAAPHLHPKKGQFCLVRLTFQNVTRNTVGLTLSAWVQRATTSDQKTHWGDLRATEAVTDRDNPFGKRVPANGRVTGTVVFDVAKGVRIIKLRVRESLLSGGVDIVP